MKKFPRRYLLLGLILVSGFAAPFLMSRRPSIPAISGVREADRAALELREGQWCLRELQTPFTGFLVEGYTDGAIRSRSAVSNGLLEGLSVGWYTNGQPQVEEEFRAGKSHGRRSKWYPDGRIMSEGRTMNGELEGHFRRWHENGTIAEEMSLHRGQPDGILRAYYPSGFIKAEARVQDGKVLEQKFWNDGECAAVRDPMNGPNPGPIKGRFVKYVAPAGHR